MEQIATIVEREGELLDVLLFKLVETRLLLEQDEHRFLSRATREVERAHRRAREAEPYPTRCAGGSRSRPRRPRARRWSERPRSPPRHDPRRR